MLVSYHLARPAEVLVDERHWRLFAVQLAKVVKVGRALIGSDAINTQVCWI
jgi:hypothetical protein